MKELQEHSIIEALEVAAAHFQWQRVQMEITRRPEGLCSFTAWAMGDDSKGLPMNHGSGETPMEAVQTLIAKAPDVSPESNREKAIRALEARLEALRAVNFGMPPYKPGSRLAEHAGETIEV